VKHISEQKPAIVHFIINFLEHHRHSPVFEAGGETDSFSGEGTGL